MDSSEGRNSLGAIVKFNKRPSGSFDKFTPLSICVTISEPLLRNIPCCNTSCGSALIICCTMCTQRLLCTLVESIP